MKNTGYEGQERRQFVRLDYITPINYKICKKETISKLLQGYTSDISETGLLCNIKTKVNKDDILWLSFDRGILSICENMEKRILIYQNGIIAKVIRIEHKHNDTYDIGVYFVTREEKNPAYIYPKIHFASDDKDFQEQEESQNEESQETPQ